MMRDHVSGHGTTLSAFGSPDHSKGRQVKRRKGKGKGRSKRTGRAFLGDEQAQDPVWWSEEDQFGGPKERKARLVKRQ